jgi:hypothetical protein
VLHDQFDEKQGVVLKLYVVDSEDQQTSFVYDDIKDYMFSNFGQKYLLQEGSQQFEEYFLNCSVEPAIFQEDDHDQLACVFQIVVEVLKKFATIDIHGINRFQYLSREQGGHSFINKTKLIECQTYILDQQKPFHDLEDPMDDWNELFFSELSNVATFKVQEKCSSNCKLQINFLLQKFQNSFIFPFSCDEGDDYFVNKMIVCIH